MIRLIATDLDGTLLNQRSEVSERTARIVADVMTAGAKFVLASGRMFQSTRPFAQSLRLNAPILVFNGAMVCDWQTGTPQFSIDIGASTARSVCAMAEARGLFIQYFPERGFFYQRRVAEVCDEYEARIRFYGEETHVPLSQWIQRPAMKLLCLGEHERLLELRAEILREHPDLSVMLSHPTYLEIVAGGVDKGRALARLCAALGVEREDVAAFGDAGNDLAMLQFAKYGYAMANADEGLLARIERHALANDDDGVARTLEQMLLRGMIGG